MECTHREIDSWCTLDGQPVAMWTCVDCGWMFDPRSDNTEHSTNRSADSAESFHKREPLTVEEISRVMQPFESVEPEHPFWVDVARAIERAHGIGREE